MPKSCSSTCRPGTGDVQLSLVQKARPDGAVIVSTPQDLALIDATRAIDLFGKTGVPVLGLIENMAGYACPHCGETQRPVRQRRRRGQRRARMGVAFLGRLPLSASLRVASDAGQPPAGGRRRRRPTPLPSSRGDCSSQLEIIAA